MDRARLTDLLVRLRSARIGVLGDFCLDAYWILDKGRPEVSLETGKPTRAVRTQGYTLGGAGNVVSNLTDLGVSTLAAFSVIGNDIFGREVLSQLEAKGVDTSGLVIQAQGWDTPVYAKPHLGSEEQERIDFGRWNTLAPDTERNLLAAVGTTLPRLDALIINQQLKSGIYSQGVVQALNDAARERSSMLFLLDARSMSGSFSGMIAKINATEAARLCGDVRRGNRLPPSALLRSYAASIGGRTGKPVYVTRGASGILLFDGRESVDIPAVKLEGPTDPVGAGDTTVSAIAALLVSGATLAEAAEVAVLASAVTVQKLQQTGTATAEEILALARRVLPDVEDQEEE